MKRYLGIDYGLRRIGLAVGDDELRIASPLRFLDAAGDPDADARLIADAARREGVDAVVVGLPLNMDGSEGPQARLTRRFIEALGRESGLPVFEEDERLSSAAADEALESAGQAAGRRAVGPRRHRGRRDALAAQFILQSFLDRSRPSSPASSE